MLEVLKELANFKIDPLDFNGWSSVLAVTVTAEEGDLAYPHDPTGPCLAIVEYSTMSNPKRIKDVQELLRRISDKVSVLCIYGKPENIDLSITMAAINKGLGTGGYFLVYGPDNTPPEPELLEKAVRHLRRGNHEDVIH